MTTLEAKYKTAPNWLSKDVSEHYREYVFAFEKFGPLLEELPQNSKTIGDEKNLRIFQNAMGLIRIAQDRELEEFWHELAAADKDVFFFLEVRSAIQRWNSEESLMTPNDAEKMLQQMCGQLKKINKDFTRLPNAQKLWFRDAFARALDTLIADEVSSVDRFEGGLTLLDDPYISTHMANQLRRSHKTGMAIAAILQFSKAVRWDKFLHLAEKNLGEIDDGRLVSNFSERSLPRKVGDPNAERTYFIQHITSILYECFGKVSPTKALNVLAAMRDDCLAIDESYIRKNAPKHLVQPIHIGR